MKTDTVRLLEIAGRLAGHRIAVWGDFILDEYIYGTTRRISREAPVLILSYSDREFTLGGAGNALQNIKALGAQPVPVGAVGRDDAGRKILAMLKKWALPRITCFRFRAMPHLSKPAFWPANTTPASSRSCASTGKAGFPPPPTLKRASPRRSAIWSGIATAFLFRTTTTEPSIRKSSNPPLPSSAGNKGPSRWIPVSAFLIFPAEPRPHRTKPKSGMRCSGISGKKTRRCGRPDAIFSAVSGRRPF
jgi:hypothetical protein